LQTAGPWSLNADQVVSLRIPRDHERGGVHDAVRCLIHTTDGKIVSVVESCQDVRKLIEAE
jgi:hypothetical protein